ncbi:GrpB family protein [Rhizobium sp. 18055]|uniref:GrpB family protein n=1 Tax=Rhizobium sp. 18055 TaxID=2681403 RepID=UPI00135A01FA|nr:GrpB family protein [Rhizobium sp. 18055]
MRPIRVIDYDPQWPQLFEAARAELLALAANRILAIDHIGSTAVPGLAAKPKIDLDAVLLSEAAVTDLTPLLQTAGYIPHGDISGEGRWTFTRDHASHGLRLYLCTQGNAAHHDCLLFRDYLRAHPQRAAEYQALKLHLAAEANGDWDHYTGGKSDFVRETIERATTEMAPSRG